MHQLLENPLEAFFVYFKATYAAPNSKYVHKIIANEYKSKDH